MKPKPTYKKTDHGIHEQKRPVYKTRSTKDMQREPTTQPTHKNNDYGGKQNNENTNTNTPF